MNTRFIARAATRFLPVIALLISPGMVAVIPTVAQDTSARSTDAVLKDFVDNCILIEPGTGKFPQQFQMGRHFESPLVLPEHTVTMTQSFRISKFEMTQDLYTAITGRNPSRWTGPRNSVESMTFLDAEVFCTGLTMQLHAGKLIAADEIVRLPTEAEWEYCCRAGTDTRYSFGPSASTASDSKGATSILNDYAWHTGNAAGNDPAVGVLKPNPWGLFDMHGYLWEFVSDEYTAPDSAAPEPANSNTATPNTTMRIIRGGSWRDPASHLTSGSRRPIAELESSDAIGFRCVISQKLLP